MLITAAGDGEIVVVHEDNSNLPVSFLLPNAFETHIALNKRLTVREATHRQQGSPKFVIWRVAEVVPSARLRFSGTKRVSYVLWVL